MVAIGRAPGRWRDADKAKSPVADFTPKRPFVQLDPDLCAARRGGSGDAVGVYA